MALNDRIRVLCSAEGCRSGQRHVFLQTHVEVAGPCPKCRGTGRDREQEARLAELAGDLLGIADDLYCNDLPTSARHIEALAAILLGAGDGAAGQSALSISTDTDP